MMRFVNKSFAKIYCMLLMVRLSAEPFLNTL